MAALRPDWCCFAVLGRLVDRGRAHPQTITQPVFAHPVLRGGSRLTGRGISRDERPQRPLGKPQFVKDAPPH